MAYTSNLRVVAAICGNFFQESGVNPGIWENLTVGAPGYGLGQWTDNPPNVYRRTALFNWLSANGFSQDSGQGQMEFLIYENLWVPSLFVQSQYNTLTDYLNTNNTSIHDLVLEWMYHWEGIDDGTDAIRLSEAQRFYNIFLNDPGTRSPWTARNGYLNQTECDNNALLIKDFLYGTTPPTPPTPTPPTDAEYLTLFMHILDMKKKGADIHIVL